MRILAFVLALVLLGAACSDTTAETPSSIAPAATTTLPPATTTTSPPTSATTMSSTTTTSPPTSSTMTSPTTTTSPVVMITADHALPPGFDAGQVLDAETRSQLPPTYLRLWFADAVVLVDFDGVPLGHVPGAQEMPEHPAVHAELNTDELRATWEIPDGCLVDAVLAEDQLRVLCTAVGEELDRNPTVEILLASGERVVVADLPVPPADIPGAFRLGHFVHVMQSPWNRGASLAQFSAECELGLALMTTDGVTRHIDGSGWWDGGYPAGAATALGWGPDQRALVWRTDSPCAEPLSRLGIYSYDLQGFGELRFPTPPELAWVELVTPEPGQGTAAIYPHRTAAELEALIAGDDPLAADVEVVTAFARDVLGIADPVVVPVSDGTDVMGWSIAGNELSARVTTRIIAWQEDGDAIVAVTSASTFEEADWFLAATVADRAGTWMAEFDFPALGDEATVTLASADWQVAATTIDSSVRMELPDEPSETPRLAITFSAGGAVVGFHGQLLPAGEFAAG